MRKKNNNLGPLRIIPSLKPFFLSKHLFLILKGGRGSGKTKSIAIFLIELARITSSRFLCLRQLQSRISESVYTVLKQTIFEQGYDSEFEILKSTIVHRSTGSEFVFMGMQRNILEIKGVEDISYCWIEEGEGLTKEQWSVISPTIRKEGSRILISLNPKHDTDFVLDELPRILGDSLLIRHINYDENPHLSQTMIKKIEQLKKADYEAYKHIYLGEPLDSNENAIITASSLRAIISDDIPQEHYDGKIVMGFDIADSGEDKCAVVVRQGSVVIHVEEWKGEVDGILKSVSKAYSIAKKHNVHHIIYDSIGVGASTGAKLTEIDSSMRHTGWNAGRSITNSRVANRRVEHTNIKNKDFYANVKAMAWWEVSRRITDKEIAIDGGVIDNKILEQLVRELSTPMKDFDNNGRVKVESKSDLAKRGIPSPNCFVGDTKILTPRGEVAIKDLKVGDYVITPMGKSKIIHTHKNSVDNIITNRGLTGTVDHKIFTWNRGWVPLQSLSLCDIIEESKIGRIKWQIMNLLYTKEKCSQFSTRVDTIVQEDTVERMLEMSDFYTDGFGSNIMAKFLQITTYIILMVTGGITTLKTWSASKLQNTMGCIWKSVLKMTHTKKKTEDNYSKHQKKQKSGTNQKKEENGTSNTRKSSLARENIKHTNAKYVEKNLSQEELTPHTLVQKNVQLKGQTKEQKHDIHQNAETAVQNLNTGHLEKETHTKDAVKNVLTQSKGVVYNITLDKHNVYYANGILVKNCADAFIMAFAGENQEGYSWSVFKK